MGSLYLLKYCVKVAMSAASALNILKYFLAASAQSFNTMIFKSNIGTADGCLLLALSSEAFWKGSKSQTSRSHVFLFCSKSSKL